ncbi:PREDICTED: multidrug resistance-associated protein 7 isoform X2 [Pseudopodoces humilis]|uniref:multidrug resistance-associated protein 7 isoform X2 n=1 Tax=Pseudopodoces humilis TaxID=181119 RepID=UPI0006B7E484|nr:PREDICTED: multidrug resistance-associated protein 7 isoform X2 [Pseudopodoces humilis]
MLSLTLNYQQRMENILAGLCGTSPEDPFPVWVRGSVGHCFNQLTLNVIPHVIFAVVSACFLGTPRSGSGVPCRPSWGWRIAASFVLAGLFFADTIPATVSQQELGPVYLEVLANGTAALTWLVHGFALLMLCRSVHGFSRGPAALALLTLLPLPSFIITLVWYCQSGTAWSPAHPGASSRFAILCLQLASLLAYVASYLFPTAGRQDFLSINHSWQQDQPISGPGVPVPDQQRVAEDGESWLSRFFYTWMNPLMKHGYQQKLNQPQDVYVLPHQLQAARVCDRFYSCWQKKAALHQAEEETVSLTSPIIAGDDGSSDAPDSPHHAQEAVCLLSVLHAAFGLRFYTLGVLKLAASLLDFSGPLLLNLLVNFMESRREPLSHGVLYALGLFAGSFLGALLRNQFSYETKKMMLMVRAAVISAIYRKALRVSSTSLAHFTVGEIVNFMSTDTNRLVNFCLSFHELWSLPVQLAITLYLLYQQVGVAFLAGVALALLLVPINKMIANRIMLNNKRMLKHKDTRVKLMTEFLCGIRVIKFYAWEKHFSSRINACRAKELQKLRAVSYLDALCVYMWAALPVVVSIAIFVTYVLLGHQLTATKVFTALALVGMLILPLNSFPWVLNAILEAKVSLDRIQQFFELMDQDLEAYYAPDSPSDTATAMEIRCAAFSWVPAEEESTRQPSSTGTLQLHIENLSLRKGMLLGVVGKVGSGKSSLLAAITGELIKQGGRMYVCDLEQGFGLATQEPWIQFTTVRENILFGREYDARLYEEVLEACALSEDLNILPAGDQTEVGENGVTLSGGQKARIALARAIYQEKDLYLLDDPLAAVDADVANHIMQKCIFGVLKHKTRVLCTHRTEFLEKADVLLLMDNGRIVKTGTPADILPLVEAFPRFKDTDKGHKDKAPNEQGQEEAITTEAEEPTQNYNLIHKEEEKKEGAVAFQVYKAYWMAMGSCLAISILFSLFLMQGLVGLALSYALSVTNLLSGLISSFTHTEIMMVSVERTEEYTTDIPVEPQEKLVQVSADWPSEGLVEFQQVVLAYRAGLPNALDGVSFTVYPGEKLGIVGRTGSGKSTLFLALFRMVEMKSGRILLDGVDSQLVGLEELRSRLAIIPQDPFLFSGSIRENLDPQGKRTDAELREVLEQCHLWDAVTQMGGLDSELGERGKSLSVGQRQLVCLARALLTQAKVLCIDEATASVDQKTDQLLQQTIRQRFADKTVLTIAHRLNTILDSDRVLVMQAGRVAELDSPARLSQKDGSLFQRLLHSRQQ